jgi:sarcosine oxidase subunit alpha
VPPRRTRKLEHPVTITLDGKSIEAEAGVSLAAALVGAGHLALARSSKFHRPRGPHCLRGGCDGCLMRVDGVPNVMTCGVSARQGARVERQNVVGVGDVDLMRATDWFFKKGINHHELLTGVPGIQKVMISFARRVSGLGELPDETRAPRAAVETRDVDVLVVGAGPAGLAAARAASRCSWSTSSPRRAGASSRSAQTPRRRSAAGRRSRSRRCGAGWSTRPARPARS